MIEDVVEGVSTRMYATILLLAFLLGLTVVGCIHYNYNILPLKMAEKNMCYFKSSSQEFGSYQPCAWVHALERK